MTETETNAASAEDGAAVTLSHYRRIGGADAVKAAVDLFYDKVLTDPDLAPYFVEIDMVEQRRHMVLMLTVVLGGPDLYAGRGLAEAHRPLHIPDEHYAKVGGHLIATLTELGVPGDILDDVRAVLVSVRDQVVSDGSPADA